MPAVGPPLRAACLLLCLLPCLAGCADRSALPDAATTFTDDLGRTVQLPDTIDRIVTLAPSLTEVVFAAGAGDRLVGVSVADDYPPAVDTLPRYNTFPIDYEALVALTPQLVLATSQVNSPRDADALAALGIPTAFLSFTSLEDVLHGIRTTGTLLGTAEAADSTADALTAEITTLRRRTAALPERPLVLFLIDDATLYAFGPESYLHDLIALAGGRSATADLQTEAPVLSEEFVLRTQPDVILGAFGEGYTADDLLALHPTWSVVPAVRDARVYSVPPNLVLRPGPRLVEGARRMAALLHPQLADTSATAGLHR